MPAGAVHKRLRYFLSNDDSSSYGSSFVFAIYPYHVINYAMQICSSRSSPPFRSCAIELISPLR